MKTVKLAIVALTMIASNNAFAADTEENLPMDLDFAVALEAAKAEVQAARADVDENYARVEIARAPSSERMIIVIGE
jgi:hypothetical protein